MSCKECGCDYTKKDMDCMIAEIDRLGTINAALVRALSTCVEDAEDRDEDMGMMGWPEAIAVLAIATETGPRRAGDVVVPVVP